MKIYQKIFAVLFLACIIGLAGVNFYTQREAIISDVKELGVPDSKKKLETYTASIDSILASDLIGDHMWNEMYGAVYKALGKNEENNFSYVRDKKGILQFADFKNVNDTEALELAERVRKLVDRTEKMGTKVIFLVYPSRFEYGVDDGYYGIPYRDFNSYADDFIRYLRRLNMDYIDFRELFNEMGYEKSDIMYPTDHHWKLESGFLATQYLAQYMDKNYNAGFDPDYFYTNPDNYITETYYQRYLGSIGREAGEIYAGLDDYTYFLPTYETQFTRMYEDNDNHKDEVSGSYSHTIMKRKYLTYEDSYSREFYNSYLGGIYRIERIVNHSNTEAPRVLFLRDSYSTPIGAFLAPMCSRLDMYWTQFCSGNYLIERIEDFEPDYIFIGFAPDKIQSSEFTFFDIEEETDDEEVAS